MSFLNIKIDTNPNLNFWDINPHMIYVKPFYTLYKADKGKDKTKSSKHMWCITWMLHPNEDENKYYRLPDDLRLETCITFNPDFDTNNEIIKECMQAFEETCLSTVERVLKAEKEALTKRAKFLREADYNLDTMAKLDFAYKATPNIMKNYEDVYNRFVESKRKTVQLVGGRQQTAAEKRLIRASLADEDE